MKRRKFIKMVGIGIATIAISGSKTIKENIDMEKDQKATFYVSTEGNDSWSGKLAAPNVEKTDGPFASIAKARDAIRQIRAKKPFTEPITVMVREGKYYLNETLVFEPVDSGTKECPITYMAYPGEKPIISGGKTMGVWNGFGEIHLRNSDAASSSGGKDF